MSKKVNENKKSSPFLIIILILNVFIISGLVSFIYFNKDKILNNVSANNVVEEASVNNSFYTFEEPFFIKLKGKSYLRASLSLSYNNLNKNILTEIEENLPRLRDKTVYVLMNKDINNIQIENIDSIKEELITEYNKILVSGQINDIYFPEFLYQ